MLHHISSFDILTATLKKRLLLPLPGLTAQQKLEPATRKRFISSFSNSETPRESAVLILLFPENNSLKTVFIQRNEYFGVHSGQVAFPGGQAEKQDIDLAHTALRETNEEIGIPANDVVILGSLSSLYIPPSNFNVLPFVGYLPNTPVFKIDPKEVSSAFAVTISEILHPKSLQTKSIQVSNGNWLDVPCYFLENKIVWGATSMILSEFIEVLNDVPAFRNLK